MADISTINGVAEDNIASWNGTAAANITSVNGDTWTHGLSATAWVWGYDEYGTAAQGKPGNVDGGQFAYSSPVQIIETFTDNEEWSAIGVGEATTHFIKNGTLWAVGSDYGVFGRGDDSVNQRLSAPIQIGSKSDWSSIRGSFYVCFGVDTSGKLYSWGSEAYQGSGRLGQGTTAVSKSVPTQIGSATNWVPNKVQGSRYTNHAVNAAGELYSWGSSGNGRIGDGTVIARSVPVQIAGTDWDHVASTGGATVAIKTDGTLWSWGAAGNGCLGDGQSAVHRSSPVQVGTDTDWGRIESGTFNYGGSIFCVKTDGTLWSWGANTMGQLGHGDVAARSSPTQVGSATNWVYDEYGYMDVSDRNLQIINQDGELWCVGWNDTFGGVGDGTSVNRSTLVQVGSATDWLRVESGWQCPHFALRTTA